MTNNPRTDKSIADLEAEMSRLLDSYRLAPHTETEYAKHWAPFEAWCTSVGRPCLPADDETLAAYVADAVPAHHADGTVGVVLAAIADRHRRAGYQPPGQTLARAARDGIAKVKGRPARRPRALTAALTERAALAAPPVSAGTRRARALLLVGHAGEIPRVHLCRLDPAGVERVEGGLRLLLPAATQRGRPVPARSVVIERTGDDLCPVAALEGLLAETGALWSPEDHTPAVRLRRAAAAAGVALAFDPYPGSGLGTEDLWRLFVHVSHRHVVYLRDKAYLLLLHAGPFGTSEPLRLHVRDLVETDEGLVVHLPWAKPDRFGRHEHVAIPRAQDPAVCPVAAMAEWIRIAGLGPDDWVFSPVGSDHTRPLGGRDAHSSVCRLTERAGIGPVSPGDVRRGFVVSAKEAGESMLSIAMAARMKRLETARVYCAAAPPATRRAPRAVGM